MWSISDLKTKAKAIFSLNYWKCVGATVIFSILTGLGASSGSSSNSNDSISLDELTSMSSFELLVLVSVVLTVLAITFTFILLIDIFVKNPLKVGYAAFLNDLGSGGNASIGYMFESLKGHYLSSATKMFVTKLITSLWGLLFVIPGIIKSYEYQMVPYILADHPDFSGKEARSLSSEMMAGNKWDAFILDLSFIGWYFLSVLTLGLLSIFYVSPYHELTKMELYKTLKNDPIEENEYTSEQ